MSRKFITEILEEIDKDPKKIVEYKNNEIVKTVFNFAFRPQGKMLLPDGDPPYKEDAAPMGMNPANFAMECQKFYVFCKPDLKQLRREQLFLQLLENLHPKEAKLVLAIKDQNLTKLYKNITHKVVHDAGFIPNPPPLKEKKTTKKSLATSFVA